MEGEGGFKEGIKEGRGKGKEPVGFLQIGINLCQITLGIVKFLSLG